MRKGWEIASLGDVCEIASALVDPRECQYQELPHVGGANIESSTGVLIELKTAKEEGLISGKFLFDEGTVLYSKIRPYLMKVARPDFRGLCSADIYPLVPRQGRLDRDYLYYLLLTQHFTEFAIAGSARAGMPKVNREHLFAYRCPVPPLPEQRRIVGILEEAFDGIAAAKTNAEKNLQNAGELFASHLAAIFGGGKWPKARIREIGEVFDGPHATPKTVKEGPIFLGISALQDGKVNLGETRHVSPDDFRRWTRRVKPQAGDFVFSYETRLGQAAVIPDGLECCLGRRMALIRLDRSRIIPGFLAYQYISPPFRDFLNSKAIRGATVDRISLRDLPSYEVALPSRREQEMLVSRLDNLRDVCNRLQSIYQHKLAALDELKKSLLHQAFTGQLVSTGPELRLAPDNTFLHRIPGISPTDLHAGLLAMAYRLHEGRKDKLMDFGHVKAEKIGHMIEARLGIDLSRAPIKDAAGPNDFPHLKKVEHRARMAKYFNFRQVEGGAYKVQTFRGIDRLIDKTRVALGQRLEEVDRLLDWMLPMTWRQAEIVATVYAAWNNLLLDGKVPSDEEIVFESRENWHPDKLKIERWRFFEAITWLRKEGVVPEGKGKRVNPKVK